jgi:para-aminobenzoate synthetase component 1
MSPERYLKKEGINILSQPIKGTSKRNIDNEEDDLLNITHLKTSEKERAENIMVVDLVRNDLSRICKEGTVKVDELCAVYSFPQVHQMISTISGILKDGIHWTDAIRQTFPMGSMTGVPKKKVMELIENYERSKRGLFSGSIGYVTPAGDFDFNVVIRSLLYNSTDKYLSFHTGSAITFSSDPETEYEECLLKAEAIKKALAETNTFH